MNATASRNITRAIDWSTNTMHIDAARKLAVVGGSVCVQDFRAAAAVQGLAFPHRPATATATFDRQLATDARRRSFLRHGTSLTSVVEVEITSPDDTTARLTRTSTRPNLARALASALEQGARISEATIRLIDAPQHVTTVFATFPSRNAAAAAAVAAVALLRPASVDLLDAAAFGVVGAFGQLDVADAGAVVLIGLEAPTDRDLANAERACRMNGAVTARSHLCPDAVTAVDTILHAAPGALGAVAHGLPYDITVPVSRLDQLVSGISAIEIAHRTTIATLANAGEGVVAPYVIPTRFGRDANTTLAAITGLAMSLELSLVESARR